MESEVGKGSTFTFVLTFGKSIKKAKQLSEGHESKNEALEGLQVLIVDDNKVNLMVAKQTLRQWKIGSDLAENGWIAVEKVQQKKYDLILMDLQMPEMDGYEAASTIRQLTGDYYKNVPIVALTASATGDIVRRVMEFGMNDAVTKPFNPQELYKKIQSLCSNPN